MAEPLIPRFEKFLIVARCDHCASGDVQSAYELVFQPRILDPDAPRPCRAPSAKAVSIAAGIHYGVLDAVLLKRLYRPVGRITLGYAA